LLKHESIKSGFNAQGILSAKEKLDVLKLSAKDRQAYDKYWQNMSFEASLVETHQVELEQAERLGKQEGIELGRQNAQQEIALQLLKSGVDKVIVAKSTNLTLSDIEALLKNIN
jgi:predicted transposase/invertase (TIGR01784 family)